MAQPDVLVINLLRYEVGAAMAPYSSVSRLFRRHSSIRWSRPYHSMIVRDEEARLGECLRSVQGFADEMVVVDTGSTDATVAIAEAAGARVEQIPWPGDFAPARNQALEFLNGDWVLVLDADEQLRPEACLLYTSPSPRDLSTSRMPSSA